MLHLLAESNNPEREKIVQERECQLEVYSPMVALLVFGGCSLNDFDHRGLTCLHVAARKATSGFLMTLIKRGADPRKMARGKQNVLHLASTNASSEAWATLLSSLPDPLSFLRAKNSAGITPLQLCCILGNSSGVTECARYLSPIVLLPAESGTISRLIKSSSQSTVLLTDILRKRVSFELLSVIFKNRSRSDITAFLDAPRITKDLGSWPNGGSWLHYCCKRGSELSIEALVRFGAKSFPDASGFLPIHYCLRRGLVSASLALAKVMSYSDWLVVDKNGRSLLHWIAATAAPPPSFNLNHQSALSPLMSCWNTFWVNIANQEIQVEHSKEDGKISSKSSKEPKSSKQSILSILCSNPSLGLPDSLGNKPIHLLAMRDVNGQSMALLCHHLKDEDVWQTNSKRNRNVLHLAALNSSHVVIDILLRRLSQGVQGKDKKELECIVNARDGRGKTPLHLAVKASNPACVQLLLDYGADPSAKDKGGRTPIAEAARIKGILTLVQFVDNGVCTYEQVVDELTCAGFRSATHELESVKQTYFELLEQYQMSLQSSSSSSSPQYSPVSPKATRLIPISSIASPERFPCLTSPSSPTNSNTSDSSSNTVFSLPVPSNGSVPLRIPPSSPTKIIPLGMPRLTLTGLSGSSNTQQPQQNEIDVIGEGERHPFLGRRSGSAPAGELSMMPGRNSPRASSSVSRLGDNTSSSHHPLGAYSPDGKRDHMGASGSRHSVSSASSSPIMSHSSLAVTSYSASNSPPSSPTFTRSKPHSTTQSPKPFAESIFRVPSFDSLSTGDRSPAHHFSSEMDETDEEMEEWEQFNGRSKIPVDPRLKRTGGARDTVTSVSSEPSLGKLETASGRVPLVPLQFHLDSPASPLSITTSGLNMGVKSAHRKGSSSGSSSHSGPASPTGKAPPMWGAGPPSPTSSTTPLSPHLSPRSMSPHAHAAGRTTPPTTPTSATGLDRMKLQRSLSPRSLPTIKEGNNPAASAAASAATATTASAKEPKDKEKDKDKERTATKRHRSGSSSSLAKKALMMRSRSLTRLPTNPGEDFLEQLKADQGFPSTPRGYTHHPGSLDHLIPSVLGSLPSHSKSYSDHTGHAIPPSSSSSSSTSSSSNASTTASTTSPPTPLKKRHKSQGKSSHQKALSTSSEPSMPTS